MIIMNILMISLDKKILQPGSAVVQRMIQYGKLCDKLAIVTLTKGGFQKTQLAENVWVYPTNSWNRLFAMFDAYKAAKEIIRKWKAEGGKWLITTQDPFETGWIGWGLKKKFGIPLQIQIHTDFLSPYFARESFWNWKRVQFAKWLIPKADNLRVVSERIRKSLIYKLKVPYSKIFLIPIYVDIEKFASEQPKFNLHQKYPNFDHIILSAGRLSKEKNLLLLLMGFKEFVKKYPKNLLLIIGAGSERQKLELQIKRDRLQKNVKVEDWTDNLVSYYKTADLFVLTSHYEGYGRTVIEAIASGLPVLMTDVGCAKSLSSGIGDEIRDKKVLAKVIENCLISDEVRQRLLKVGQEIIKECRSEEELLTLHKKSWTL